MDVWGANTFPMRKYNSRTFHLKVRRSRLFRFFRRFSQINVGGDSARIPFMEHASRESRVALPPKGRLRQPVHEREADPPTHIMEMLEDPTMPVLRLSSTPLATPVLHLTDEEDMQDQDTQGTQD